MKCLLYSFYKIISIEKDGDIKNFITMSTNLPETNQTKLKIMVSDLKLDQIIEEEILEIKEISDLSLKESDNELTSRN